MKENEMIVVLVDDVMRQLYSLKLEWKDFKKTLGAAAQSWEMYIDMVLILKRYIHAERAGLWRQHLLEIQDMLPYTIASGHNKYMAYLPIYFNERNYFPNCIRNTENLKQATLLFTRKRACSIMYGQTKDWNKLTIMKEKLGYSMILFMQRLFEKSI